MDAFTYLREHVPLFKELSDENLTRLAGASSVLSYAQGATILFKGMTVDGLHVVLHGKVTVHAKVPNKGLAQVAELGPAEVFGETSIVEMGTAGATIKSAAESTMVLLIPQEAFRHVLMQDEAFAVRVNTLIRSRKNAGDAAKTTA